LRNVDLSGAILTNADLSGVVIKNAGFGGALLDGVDLTKIYIHGSDQRTERGGVVKWTKLGCRPKTSWRKAALQLPPAILSKCDIEIEVIE
jgi:Pentapeptide repeats (8 copies)